MLSKNARWLKESGLTNITLDADLPRKISLRLGKAILRGETVKSVCANQESAAKGFNTTKKGAKSYHPLLVFVSEMKLLYHTWFRTGSAYTGNGIVDFLKEVKSSLPETIDTVFFRADAYTLSVMMRQKKIDLNDRSTGHLLTGLYQFLQK